MTQMSDRMFARVKPCKKCPFRTDVEPYLRQDRVTEIVTNIQQGGAFYCHETTVVSGDEEDEMAAGPDSSVCAGSIIVMEKMDQPNQHLRIAERMGSYDRSRMHLDSPVHGSWLKMQRHFADPEEQGETCEVCGPYCEAPAGMMIGGAVIKGTVFVNSECSMCGRPVCDSCMADGMCDDCQEEDEDA